MILEIWNFIVDNADLIFLYGFCAVALVFMIHTMYRDWRENAKRHRHS